MKWVCALVFQEVAYVPTKLLKAEKRIAAHPFDMEAWSALIRDAQVSITTHIVL